MPNTAKLQYSMNEFFCSTSLDLLSLLANFSLHFKIEFGTTSFSAYTSANTSTFSPCWYFNRHYFRFN